MLGIAQARASAAAFARSAARSASVFLRDAGQGLLEVGHNSLALLGLLTLGLIVFAACRADLRQSVEAEALSWLQARQEARAPMPAPDAEALGELGEPDAIARATASDPKELNRAQASVATWLSRRYHVAVEPVSRLVQEAWSVGQTTHLDPTLILAVMAVESSFNPFAQSPVGAQGLMQVMTKVHDDKYVAFGGRHAAFDPVTNLRVGVLVLKECIDRAGGLEAGLRSYVGAANSGEDGGYASKVLAEQSTLRLVAGGAKIQALANVPHVHRDPTPEAAPAQTGAEPVPAAPAATEPPAAAAVDKVALLH